MPQYDEYTTVGASVLLRYNNLLLFEVQKRQKWQVDFKGVYHIGIGCIGGSHEPGETPVETLQRECVEEIGTEIAILRNSGPFALQPDNSLMELKSAECPEGLWFCWREDSARYPKSQVAVFLGEMRSRPIPLDVGGLLQGSLESLQLLFARRVPAIHCIGMGITISEREAIPENAIFYPVGTTRKVLLLLDSYKDRLRDLP